MTEPEKSSDSASHVPDGPHSGSRSGGAGPQAKVLSPRQVWGRRLVLLVHWVIIANLAAEVIYSSYMVFAVLRPEGVSGPLWQAARTLPMDLMMRRRLYAIEGWIAIGALSIYLAITEIGPRLRGERGSW